MKINLFMSIIFLPYKKRTDHSGAVPIYCRITIDGRRSLISTGKRVILGYWHSKANKVINNYPGAAAINEDLESMKGDLRIIYNQLTATNKYVTAEMVKLKYTGKGQDKKTLMDLFNLYTNLVKEKYKQKKVAYATLQKFQTLTVKLQHFLKKEYGTADKSLCDLNSAFGENFRHYLSVHENLAENTTNKYLKQTSQVLNFGKLKRWMQENPMAILKCPYKHPPRVVLTMAELLAVQEVSLPTISLNEIRDVYVFSCYTGYAYKELRDLTPGNVVIGMDGNKWISIIRHKTSEPQIVPLLPFALDIIENYKDHPWCIRNNKLLPVRSNQKYNAHLKEIAAIAGINKYLTTHTARHTFATTVTLEHDVPMETVSKLLGHTSIKTTQIYAKVSLKKLSNNMNELSSRLSLKYNSVKSES